VGAIRGRTGAVAAPQPSARLIRAVAAEREQLRRQREKLATEAGELRAALARIESGLVEIDERWGLLDRLAPPEPQAPPAANGATLRGPAIREVAVRTLVDHGRDAAHYREWFELVTAGGHAIAGKDPLAVFLTQLSRSPAVRKGGRAGVYELDRQAPARLRATLDRLQSELRELTVARGQDIAARRTRLTAEIGRAERALEEVERTVALA
jgi:hypothetical protein